MDILPADSFHRLRTGIRFKKPVTLRRKIDLQSIYNIRLVVTDQNIIHKAPSCF